MSRCRHHYILPPPDGPSTLGVCICSCGPESDCRAVQRRGAPSRGCGKVRTFDTTNETTAFNNPAKQGTSGFKRTPGWEAHEMSMQSRRDGWS